MPLDVALIAGALAEAGVDFIAGVPDSTLPGLGEAAGVAGLRHVVSANEGAAVAMAAGVRLAGGASVVYMQNAGLGVALDVHASLTGPDVLGCGALWIVGWRGAPVDDDTPAHRWHGEATPLLLEAAGIHALELPADGAEATSCIRGLVAAAAAGESCALLVRRGQLVGRRSAVEPRASDRWDRAAALEALAGLLGPRDRVVASAGYPCRELARVRPEAKDVWATGGMGHESALALGLALSDPTRRVVTVQGDGAAVMHLGTLANLAAAAPASYVHVVLDNGCHESVGGTPSAFGGVDAVSMARAMGFTRACVARTPTELRAALEAGGGPRFVHVPIRRSDGPPPPRPPASHAATPAFSLMGPRLFTPGPGRRSAVVTRAAMVERGSRSTAAHRATQAVRDGVLGCVHADPQRFACVPMAGSATTALDAAMHQLPTARVFVLDNGVYGERLAALARRRGHDVVHQREQGRLDAEAIERLGDVRSGDWLAFVHGETSTGMLNDAAAVCVAAREAGLRVLLDATGTLGLDEVELEDWGCTVVVGSSAKGFEAPAGLGIVVAERAWLEQDVAPPMSLDLGAQYRRLEADGQFRFTPPTGALQGLAVALQQHREEGGTPARGRRYRALARRLCEGLSPLGIVPLLAEDDRMALIVGFESARWSMAEIRSHLEPAGVEIYADPHGHPRRFRLGLVGVRDADVDVLLDTLRSRA